MVPWLFLKKGDFMRMLHTADWHIGKQLSNINLIEDQEYILKQIIQIIKEEKPNVLIIAGDIYDRSIPSVEAVNLLDKVFNEILLELNTPIIAIAGNHDNGERISFASDILKKDNLYIEGNLKPVVNKIVLRDEYGPVNFYVIPYAEPPYVRELYNNSDIKTYDDAMKEIIRSINQEIDLSQRNVAITHGFVIGLEEPETCESERTLSVGKAEYVSYEHFKQFNYTALGHLHCRQKAGDQRIRYSGSPLKYSVSEVKHRKGVELVDIDGDGNTSIRFIELKPKRDLRVIEGRLDELLAPDAYKNMNTEDYIHAVITDEGELIDPIGKLRAVYPNILSMERRAAVSRNKDSKTSAGKDFKQKTRLQLFKDFYESMTGMEFTQEKQKIMEKVISGLNNVERGE